MALDKLVDSTQLDADLASVANAIRTKGGTSAQLAFPAGFVSAVDAIPTGGGGTDYFQYARRLDGFFYVPYGTTYTFPVDEIEITAPLVTSYLNFFSTGAFSTTSCKARGVKKITLNVKYAQSGNSTTKINGAKDLEEVAFTFADSGNSVDVIDSPRADFQYLQSLKKITGIRFRINGSHWAATTVNNPLYFPTGSNLEEVRFEEGTGSVNIYLGQHSKLSDATLVSLGNGLDGSVTGKTVTLHSDCKVRLSTIMGTISAGVFTLDAQGTDNLNDFITTTKGWTVA